MLLLLQLLPADGTRAARYRRISQAQRLARAAAHPAGKPPARRLRMTRLIGSNTIAVARGERGETVSGQTAQAKASAGRRRYRTAVNDVH